LSNNNYNHVDSKIKSSKKSFYVLQSIRFYKSSLTSDIMKGFYVLQSIRFYKSSLTSDIMSYMCKIVIQPILLYAIQCYLPWKNLYKLDKFCRNTYQLQALKMDKFCRNTYQLQALKMDKFCRNTYQLQALKIQKPSTFRDGYKLDSISSDVNIFSKGRIFYMFILK